MKHGMKQNMSHNFLVPIVDTDSCTICKPDGSAFTPEEIEKLTEEINSLTEELIIWDLEFYIPKIIVLKSKNYILDYGDEVKTKGSSIRDQKKEPALRELMDEIIKILLDDADTKKLSDCYTKYAKEIDNITDIKRWATKKSYTLNVQNSTRTNQTKVIDAIQGTDYRVGDKMYLFYRQDDSLCLVEHFNGDYSRKRLYKRLFDTIKIFKNVLPVKELFSNYSLKGQQKKLQELMNG